MATKEVKNKKSIVPEELGCTTPTKDSIVQVRKFKKNIMKLTRHYQFLEKIFLGKTDLLKSCRQCKF